jgi:predicted phosphodiesterase
MLNILVIGDTHFPYHCKSSFSAMYSILKKLPDFTHIIQIGDLYDLYNLSRYPRSMDLDKPAEEIKKGRVCAEKMWRKLRKLYPEAKCYQLIGNHDDRLRKQVISKLPELYDLIDMAHLWKFDGVSSQSSQAEELIIKLGKSEVIFIHGHYGKIGQHLNHNMSNTAYGHSHKGSCYFRRLKDAVIWEINAATMADLTSLPLSYTAQRKFSSYMNGFAIIDDLGPRFIPLVEGKTWSKI